MLCPDCLKPREQCGCPRCKHCDALEDYCECGGPTDVLLDPRDRDDDGGQAFDFDDNSDDLTDKEEPQWE